MTDEDWPWRSLNALAIRLTADLRFRVRDIMREAGEDPDDEALFRTRCAQVVDSMNHLEHR